jgi:hypothetical protein
MKTVVDARLLEEASRLRFRFACEDCVHFCEVKGRCSLGYHAAPRRAELEGRPVERTPAGPHTVELCKTYELA